MRKILLTALLLTAVVAVSGWFSPQLGLKTARRAAPSTNILLADSENLSGDDWQEAGTVLAVHSPGEADPFGTSTRVTALTSQLCGSWASVNSPTTHRVDEQYVVAAFVVRSGGIDGGQTDLRLVVPENAASAQVVANCRITWAASGATGAAISSVAGSATVGGVVSGTNPVVTQTALGGGYHRVTLTVNQTAYSAQNYPFRLGCRPWCGSGAISNQLFVTGVQINAGNTLLDYEPTTTPAGLIAEDLPRMTHVSFYARGTGNSKRGVSASTWTHSGTLSMRLVRADDVTLVRYLGSSPVGVEWPPSEELITGLTTGKFYYIEYQLALTTPLDNWSDTAWRRIPWLHDTGEVDEYENPIWAVDDFSFLLTTFATQYDETHYYPWPE